MKKLLRTVQEVGGALLYFAMLIASLLVPLFLFFLVPLSFVPLGLMAMSLERSPHLFTALISLPPLLCLLPLLAMLPPCLRSCAGRERARLLALAVPAALAGLLCFGGSLVLWPFSLGWRCTPYLAMTLMFYGTAIPLAPLLVRRYHGLHTHSRLSVLGTAARAALVLLLIVSVFSWPVVGYRDRVYQTTSGPAVLRWPNGDYAMHGMHFRYAGPLLYGEPMDIFWSDHIEEGTAQ